MKNPFVRSHNRIEALKRKTDRTEQESRELKRLTVQEAKLREKLDPSPKTELQTLSMKFEEGVARPSEIERLVELADKEIKKTRR